MDVGCLHDLTVSGHLFARLQRRSHESGALLFARDLGGKRVNHEGMRRFSAGRGEFVDPRLEFLGQLSSDGRHTGTSDGGD